MKAPERREQILSTGRRLFAQWGYEETSVDDIADATGVTKPIVYRHFASKRDLYLAVLEDHLNDLIARLWVALSSSPDPRERLRRGIEAYFRFVDEREDGFRMLVEAGARFDPGARAKLASAWDTLADGVARTVGDILRAAGLDPAGAPVYARAMIGMTQAVADWWVRTKRVPIDELVDYLLALTWRGFDGLPRQPTRFHGPVERPSKRPSKPTARRKNA
jgi:AcrR family transcriptional regulator